MSTEPAGGHQDAGDRLPQLRAVQAGPGAELEPAEPSGPPVYQDVTAPGERKQILPDWMASVDAAKHHGRRAGGYAWHSARYHGLRSPAYLVQLLFWAQVGAVRLLLRWLHWWLLL